MNDEAAEDSQVVKGCEWLWRAVKDGARMG